MIPNSFLSPNSKPEITQEERDQLMWFNTRKYWHCYYNPETKVLYSQFGCRLIDNAFDYLLDLGLINEKNEMIQYFEE